MAEKQDRQEASQNKEKMENKEQEEKEAVEEKETKGEEEQGAEQKAEGAEKEEGEKSDKDERIEELKKQMEDLNEKHLRLFSEFDNYKKRTKKEKSELIKSAGEDVIGEILPVLDDFERAIGSNQEIEEDDERITKLKEGFELIYNKLKKTLESKGLQEMEAEGEEFNTDRHEAMTRMPAQNEEQKGKVVEVVQKGYYLNEKVLRYAKVVVGE